MIEVNINEKVYLVPNQWDELKLADMRKWVLLLQTSDIHLVYIEFFVYMLLQLGDRKTIREYMRLRALASCKESHVKYLDDFNDFKSILLITGEQCFSELAQNTCLYVNPMPTIKGLVHGVIYQGMEDGCTNMTFSEFAQAESIMRAFQSCEIEFEKESLLNDLMLILYLPQCHERRKTPETKKDILFHKDDIAALPLADKLIGLYLFVSYLCRLKQEFPLTFSDDEESSSGASSFGYGGLIVELAGTKFGDVDKTADTNFETILVYLEQEKIKYNEFMAKHGK